MIGLSGAIVKWAIIIATSVVLITLIFLIVRKVAQHRAIMGKLVKRLRHRAMGVVLGVASWQMAFCSPESDEGAVICFGGTGSGKTASILIPSLRAWRGTTFVIDISGDIAKNVSDPTKIIYAPENDNTVSYDVFASVDAAATAEEKDERLQQLSFALIPAALTDSDTTKFYKTSARTMLQAALMNLHRWGNSIYSQPCENSVRNPSGYLYAHNPLPISI